MSAPFTHRAWTPVLALVSTLLLAASSAAAPGRSIDRLSFSARDQGLWAPGDAPDPVDPFLVPIIEAPLPAQKLGKIGREPVPNPAWAAWLAEYILWQVRYETWRVAYNGCRNNGLIDPGDRFCRGVVGNPPREPSEPSTLLYVKNGAEIRASAHMYFGLEGELIFEKGDADIDYTTQATLELDRPNARPGELVTLSLREQPLDGHMETEFGRLAFELRSYLDMAAHVTLEAYVLGVGDKVDVVNFDTGRTTTEIFYAEADLNDGELYFRVLGSPNINLFEEGIEQQFSITVPGIPLAFPFADLNLWLPALRTPGAEGFSAFDVDETVAPVFPYITNELRPGDRTGIQFGFPETTNLTMDFAKTDLDVDVLSLHAGAPLGAVAEIPEVAEVEVNILDADFGAYHSIGQTFVVEPLLFVELTFNVPTLVEVEPGSGHFAQVRQVSLPVGDELRIVVPDEDFVIEPVYLLGGDFAPQRDYLLSFVYTQAFLQVKPGGPAFDAARLLGVDIPDNIALYEAEIPIGDPIVADRAETLFALETFDPVAGTPLTLGGGSGCAACDADFDGDGFVGGRDFDVLLQCFNRAVGPGGPALDPTCSAADMNGDGFVGGPDADAFMQVFNQPAVR